MSWKSLWDFPPDGHILYALLKAGSLAPSQIDLLATEAPPLLSQATRLS